MKIDIKNYKIEKVFFKRTNHAVDNYGPNCKGFGVPYYGGEYTDFEEVKDPHKIISGVREGLVELIEFEIVGRALVVESYSWIEPKEVKKGYYRHFKGNWYNLLDIAKHHETGAHMAVYQALYGTEEMYIRPLSEFLGELDKKKYPKAKQKCRFQYFKEIGE